MSYGSCKYYIGDLYAGIAMDVKKINNYLQNLYASITMDGKINNYLQGQYANITMDVTNQQLFKRPICGYNIFQMALWKLE